MHYKWAKLGAISFIADTTQIPCGKTVLISASGGGVSGEGTVQIAGQDPPPPTEDTLRVWTSPSSIAPGDSARVFAKYQQTGCPLVWPPADSTAMTVTIFPSKGELAHEMERGRSLDVSYGDLEAGDVWYVADSSATDSTDCGTVWIGVSGGGTQGQASVEVQSDGGPDPFARPAIPTADTTQSACGKAVPIFASGGGVSGEGTVYVTGQDPPPTGTPIFDVWTSPSSIATGDSAGVYARYRVAGGCGGGELPDSTQMIVSVDSALRGSLAYGGQRGATISGVPYGEVEAGAVAFVADGEEPLYDDEVAVSVTGGGESGTASVVVQGDIHPIACTTGDPVLDAAASSDVLKELWEASKPQADVRDRREQGVWIVQRPDGSYLFVPYGGTSTNCTINPASFPDPSLGTLLGGVHTHPASLGERLWGCPRNRTIGTFEEPARADVGPGKGDTDGIKGDEEVLGIELNSYIIDPGTVYKYDEGGVLGQPIQRCGY